jgi:hypothetical protein
MKMNADRLELTDGIRISRKQVTSLPDFESVFMGTAPRLYMAGR